MDSKSCKGCAQVFQEWVEFCPKCGEPMEGYSRPAGFWVRLGSHLIDFLVFIPFAILSFWNYFSFKSTTVLVLTSLPGFLYKPFMESFYGATLGKMANGIKVIDDNGSKLSLSDAYLRAVPFLIASAVGLTGQLMLFSSPQFQSATSLVELGQANQGNFLDLVGQIVNLLLVIECVVAAFTFRKRALHDMLAESYCVYKGPEKLSTEVRESDVESE